jgi:hypothetical protein
MAHVTDRLAISSVPYIVESVEYHQLPEAVHTYDVWRYVRHHTIETRRQLGHLVTACFD